MGPPTLVAGIVGRDAGRKHVAVAFAVLSIAMLAKPGLSEMTWMLPALGACALHWERRQLAGGLALAGILTVAVALNVRLAASVVANEQVTAPLAPLARIGSDVQRTLPRDAVLAVPPGIESARPFLRRSIYVTLKDGAAYLWNPGYEVEYLRRLSVLHVPYTPGRRPDLRSADREFVRYLPESLPVLEAEGVTHVLLRTADVPPGATCSPRTADYCVLGITEARRVFPSGVVSSVLPGTPRRR